MQVATALYDFRGKVAFITGGASGIGLETAIGFARCGANVVIMGRNEERGTAAQAKIAQHGVEALFVQGDVASPDDMKRAIDDTLHRFGRLDFSYNNAAVEFIGGRKLVTDTAQSEFDQFVQTNIGGVFNGLKRQIPAILKTAGRGAIVNMTTLAGSRPVAEVGDIYSATRHAINGLTTSAAREWAAKGVRINAVSAGSILSRPHTPREPALTKRLVRMHPIGRLGQPREVADAVLWLCSEHSSFVVGAFLNVDGGMSIA